MLQAHIVKDAEALNADNVGLGIINDRMEIVWANKMLESWLGPSEQILGKKCYACFEKKNTVCEACPVEKAFMDKKPHTSAIRIGFDLRGKKRYYKVTATPILGGEGEAEKVLLAASDITEKRKQDIRSRRRSVEIRKINGEVERQKKSFKKLVNKHSVKLRLANRELKNIYELGNILVASLNVNEVIHSIVNIAPKLLKISGCIVRIVDETTTKLTLEAACGASKGFQKKARLLSVGEGISGLVAESGVPIAVSDLSKDRRAKYSEECSTEGICAVLAVPIKFKNKLLGVLIAFSKKIKHWSEPEINLLSIFATHAAIALNNAMLHNQAGWNYYNTMITLVKAMEAKDPYTRGHSERVTSYAIKIARKLELNESDMQLLLYGGKLHDIGKIAIPDFILRKKSALTPGERAEIEAHPLKGIAMITRLKFLEKSFPLIRHHHERYDGRGYPDKLKGREIPLLARILAIADAFDAMTSERPYRKGFAINKAIREIERNSKTQFDPQLSKLFLSILREAPRPD